MSAIPTRSRTLVATRDRGRCMRCGAGRNLAWHHRRSRRVADRHQHCPCVGILLCTTCHTWAHAHPEAAGEQGLIVSIHVMTPYLIPVKTYAGWFQPDCVGTYQPWLTTG